MLKWLLSLFGVKTPVDISDSVLSQKKDQLDELKELTVIVTNTVTPKVYQNVPVQNKKSEPVKVAPKAPPKVAQVKTESPTKAWVDDTPTYVTPVYVPTYDTTDYSSRCSDSYSSSSYSSSDSGSSCSSSFD